MSAILYVCDTHGRLYECSIGEAGSRVCPECGRHVDVLSDTGSL